MDHVSESHALLQDVQDLYHKIYDFIARTQSRVNKIEDPIEDLVDIGFFFREMGKVLDECRKDCQGRSDLIGKIIALYVAKNALNDPDSWKGVIHGRYASGSPDLKQAPKLPKRGTEGFDQLMQFLGITKEQSEFLSFRFSEMRALISDKVERGEKLPPGVDATFSEYSTTYRKKTNNGEKNNDE